MKLFLDTTQSFITRSPYSRKLSVLFLGSLSACLLYGQAAAKPEPDVLIITDGETLVGHVVSGMGS